MTFISFQSFPRTEPPPSFVDLVSKAFAKNEVHIGTRSLDKSLKSDEVLEIVANDLIQLGFEVERGKKKSEKISVPVLYGELGIPDLRYEVDAFNESLSCGIEVEAGRSLSGGNAIYRDLFQAMVMSRVKHMIIAVPNLYRSKPGKPAGQGEKCYEGCLSIAETLYSNPRAKMPYGLTILGY